MKEVFPIIKIPKSRNCQYFLLFLFVDHILATVATNVLGYFDNEFGSLYAFKEGTPEILIFLGLVVIAPIFETLVFQFVVLESLLKIKVSASIALIISTVLFSLFHYYSLTYILYILCSGWILSYYYLALRHQGKYNKVLLVILLHALGNLPVFFEYL